MLTLVVTTSRATATAKKLISGLAIRTSLPSSAGTISCEGSPDLPDRDTLAAVGLVSRPELVVEPASTCGGDRAQ